MLQVVKNTMYSTIVATGILYYLIPILKIIVRLIVRPGSKANHCIVDAGGSKMRTTKWRGKLYPPVGEDKLSGIKDFRVRDSDVILCGYPKTGCHWLYEILYMLLNNTSTISKHGKEFGGMIDVMPDVITDSLPSPRVLNSHMLYDQLPEEIKTKKTKIVLTVRSAKDTVVSYYNHHKTLSDVYDYDGVFENFFKLFVDGNIDYGCYFDYTLDWDKVMSSHPANEIFVVQFEDLKADPAGMIKKLAQFLDIKITDRGVEDVATASQFSNMKKARSSDPMAAKLFRKGVVGDWKNWMTPEQKEEIDRKWKETMRKCKNIQSSA